MKAQADLKTFYENSIRHHEDMIDAYRNSNDPVRFDKILGELNALAEYLLEFTGNSCKFIAGETQKLSARNSTG